MDKNRWEKKVFCKITFYYKRRLLQSKLLEYHFLAVNAQIEIK